MSQKNVQADILSLTPQVSVPTLSPGQVAFGPEGLTFGTTAGNKTTGGKSNTKLIVPVGASITRTGGSIVINGGPLLIAFPEQNGFFNTIGVQTSPSIADGQAAFVTINREAVASNPLTIQVANITALSASEDVVVLAYRASGVIYWGPDAEKALAASNDSTVDSFLGPLIVNDATASSYFPNLKNGLVYFDTTLLKYKVYSVALASWQDLGSSSNDDIAYLKTGQVSFEASGVVSGPTYTDVNNASGLSAGFSSIPAANFYGQSFIPNSNLAVTQIQTHVRRNGSPDANIVMEIYEWSPTGGVANAVGGTRGLSPIATSAPVPAATVTTSTTTLTAFTFSSLPLVIPSKQYVFLLKIANIVVYDASNNIFVNYAGVDNYSNGSITTGSQVSPSLGGVAADLNFILEGQSSTVPGLTLSANTFVQVANLPADRHTILAQTIPFTADDQVAYISINRAANAATNRSVFVENLSLFSQDGNKIVIARRQGGKAYLGIFDPIQIGDAQIFDIDLGLFQGTGGGSTPFLGGNSGNFTLNSTTFTTVTNMSAAFVKGTRPVKVSLMMHPSAVGGAGNVTEAAGNSGQLRILRDATPIAVYILTDGTDYPSSTFNVIDDVAGPGTYTYSVQVRSIAGPGPVYVFGSRMVIEEI